MMRRTRGSRHVVTSLALSAIVVTLSACDPASLYGPLQGQWTRQTGGAIAAKPAVGSGTVYMGSWDGKEYALDEASGAVRWSSDLGVTNANCDGFPLSEGVTSSPSLQGSVAYLGGGASTWDALDTATGNILWTVPTGDNSAVGGHYNWSSPAVDNGYAYVGIASFCDSPLVQGQLLRVNLGTHQIDNVFKVVPDGDVGGSIWTNPVIDSSLNTVFIATGNAGGSNEPYAQAFIALDATTLAVKGVWTLPASQDVGDADFGTTPVLFTDSTGRRLVAVTNKNGIVYAFDRSNLSGGPVWEVQISEPSGPCFCTGSYSTGVFDGTRLYFAAGATTIDGAAVAGSIRAIDPGTGAFVWEHALPAQVFGALAEANGMIAVPSSDGGLYIVRASDGAVVHANGLTGPPGESAIYAPPTIAAGSLFIGTTDGVVHAFSFPTSATPSGASPPSAGAAAASCTGVRTSEEMARCRVTIPSRTRCVRVGELPGAVGAVELERIVAHVSHRGARPWSRVRLYLNGSCAGRARFVITLVNGHRTLRFTHPLALAPGTVASVSASRSLALRLSLVGRGTARSLRGHLGTTVRSP